MPGELLVKTAPEAAAARAVVDWLAGSVEVERIDAIHVARLRLRPGLSPPDAARFYESLPFVEYAEPNYVYRNLDFPKDPLYAGNQRWYYDVIEGPAAWDIETGDASVVVAVVDTGVDITHPDLQGGIWSNPAELTPDGVDNDNNGCVDDAHGCNFVEPDTADPACVFRSGGPSSDVRDDDGHGTFVAGVVAARANNEIGVVGAARGVTVMPVKVLSCTGGGATDDVAAGIIYAAKSGADVMNLSFGGFLESDTLTDAIEMAHDDYGVLLVAASGNSGRRGVIFPASLPQVMAVGASDHARPDERAPFTTYGPEVEVVAPGVDIASTVPERVCGPRWLCLNQRPYAVASGTSFSAPLVSGLAALVLSKSPQLDNEGVRAVIRESAQPLSGGPADWAGSGRIRMSAALGQGGPSPPPQPIGANDLVAGCQLRALVAWPAGTQLTEVTSGISAPDANPRLWFQVPGSAIFELFDPGSLERSTKTALEPGDEAAVVCVDVASAWARPGA